MEEETINLKFEGHFQETWNALVELDRNALIAYAKNNDKDPIFFCKELVRQFYQFKELLLVATPELLQPIIKQISKANKDLPIKSFMNLIYKFYLVPKN